MKKILLLAAISCLLLGCKKYLDQKPDQKLQLPDNLNALQALLDNDGLMNTNSAGTGEVSADNYYVTYSTWAALTSASAKNMYTWEDDITLFDSPNHWSRTYDGITDANVVLEKLETITPAVNEQQQWNNIKGAALFYRSRFFLIAAGLWAKAYDKITAATDPGIPLRLKSDFSVLSVRSTVKQTYDQVLSDLKAAGIYLPVTPLHVMRPSKTAADGLLARTYLMMGMYDSALVYATKSLAANANLLNYNNLSSAASFPFAKYNSEVIIHTQMNTPTILTNTKALVDSDLYRSYAVNDLRKTLFFKSNGNGTYGFKGSYSQSGLLFTGICTDELYLIKAECLARQSNITEAMAVLNNLMITRWKTGTFVTFAATDTATALNIILKERRKELIFRDLRWTDLKRLNKDPATQQTVQRTLNGVDYFLRPNENRYALPIPSSVIALTGMMQNPR
ncbi:RagB/SusD family nutrient uptake outer membrane protein [Ferruginibacter sp. SUN106]|uniref:RagB/SusD family nutrient uptake outer membrane protein n=1 Tax=Ferruginibacter sp. SUN106 TaxID=2978348 RepID=UPI003D36B426